MHLKWLMLVGVLTAPAAGCAYGMNGVSGVKGPGGSKAASAYDGRVDFSHYYSFFILQGNSSGDPVTDERLADGVRSTLMSKGWVELPEGAGQAAVVIHTATTAVHSYDSFYGGWGGWQSRWNGVDGPSTIGEDYRPGTMVVTIFDADSKQAIWRGSATDAISANPKHAVRAREAAVVKMFGKFPPIQ
jgi:hypothetical protein